MFYFKTDGRSLCDATEVDRRRCDARNTDCCACAFEIMRAFDRTMCGRLPPINTGKRHVQDRADDEDNNGAEDDNNGAEGESFSLKRIRHLAEIVLQKWRRARKPMLVRDHIHRIVAEMQRLANDTSYYGSCECIDDMVNESESGSLLRQLTNEISRSSEEFGQG